MPFTLHGLAVSQGIAIGHVHLVSHALLEVNHYHVAPRYLDEELAPPRRGARPVQGEVGSASRRSPPPARRTARSAPSSTCS